MNDRTVGAELNWAWAQQRVWSVTANDLKRQLDRARQVALLLSISAATLAVAATQLSDPFPDVGRALGAAAAVSAGLATVVQRRVGTDQIRAWTRVRSLSEGLKTEVYSYVAGGTAYTNIATRAHVLAGRSREMVGNAADLQRHTIDVNPDGKAVPSVANLADYLSTRVGHQINNYYRPQARGYERRVRRLRRLGQALGAVTVILAAVAASFDWSVLAAWVPVATTAGTSLAAYIAAARYDHLIIRYLLTAQRLEDLRNAGVNSPIGGAQLIDACEAAISAENQGWMARWTIEDTDNPQPT